MNIELYIDNILCDTGKPEDMGIVLKRQFINPAELNLKDAQKSYTITLPASDTNNRIFGYTTTEEVRGKFARIYDARLIVGNTVILDGKFRLSEIDRDHYKGNLGVPSYKSVKDVFGERTMAQAGEWKIPFDDFADSVKHLNEQPDAPCIFPYVLYGLIPKTPQNGVFSDKNVWDNSVTLNQNNLPPSINCLQAIRKIFENEYGENLDLSGTAFNDERLKKLYMSYSNPTDYQMPWNYGTLGNMKMRVQWSNKRNYNKPENIGYEEIERGMVLNTDPKDVGNYHSRKYLYNTNLFNSTNAKITEIEDNGNNITTMPHTMSDGHEYQSTVIKIPYSGLYKITLHGKIELVQTENNKYKPRYNDINVIGAVSKRIDTEKDNSGIPNSKVTIVKHTFGAPSSATVGSTTTKIESTRTEIKLLKYKSADDIELSEIDIDRGFYKDNLEQDKDDNYPKYFPNPGATCFIDPMQDADLLCGFSFGRNYNYANPVAEDPNASVSRRYANPIAIKAGKSWNPDTNKEMGNNIPIAAATESFGYKEVTKENLNTGIYPHSDRYRVWTADSGNEIYATTINEDTLGTGFVHQIVWLEQGDVLALVATTESGVNAGNYYGTPLHDLDLWIEISAYMKEKEWLASKITNDEYGNSIGVIDFGAQSDIDSTELNLTGFLPTETRIDEWLDNFCKAFNLTLSQTGEKVFELNVKQAAHSYAHAPLCLDHKACTTRNRSNTSLGLPSAYEIGFTISKDEEGYISSSENDDERTNGGGTFYTGNTEGSKINQSTPFSYNWFKPIIFANMGNKEYSLPVISEHEPWHLDITYDYADMMAKPPYWNLPQRFWYKDERRGNLTVNGLFEGQNIDIALVSNTLPDKQELSYYDRPYTILRNYFTLFVDNQNSYTTVECYLTPDEYEKLAYCPVQLNGDLYYVAEIDKYDPLMQQPATLKLIKKMI